MPGARQVFCASAGAAALCLVAALVSLPAAASPAAGQGNPHGEILIACSACHTTAAWRPLREPLGFDHADTGFALAEGHADRDCADCHSSLQFAHVPSACADCHVDTHRGEMGFGCESCHTPSGWQDRWQMYVMHFTTSFPLQGGHASLDCDACHRAQPPFEFAGTPVDCYACHATDYAAVDDPEHVEAGFPTDCQLCHDIDGWQGATFVEHQQVYPLIGAHARADCSGCHTTGFAGTPTDCFACHRADYEGAEEPDHDTLGLPTTCDDCHTPERWQGAEFPDHSLIWPLTGAHRALDCSMCHTSGFVGTPTSCYGCHASDYDQTSDPDHERSGFSTDCENCHTTRTWESGEFDHRNVFPLIGAHRQLECEACHSRGFAGTPSDCYSCHRLDYEGTTDPDHVAADLPLACEACHNQRDWTGAVFDHSVFPLTGAHGRLDCAECHTDGFTGTSPECYSCHRLDYEGASDPDHRAANFPLACEACHDNRSWQGAVFDHDALFQLSGVHRTLECVACHADGYAGTPRDCYGCHRLDFEATTDPDHGAEGFPLTCETCHGERNWGDVTFDHSTVFVLAGAHARLNCAACHASGFAGTPRDCYACHVEDYDATTDPDHAAAGFPVTCESCHNERTWEGATFDHDAVFSLQGAHATLDCLACHSNGYSGTPTDCYACHRQEYEQTVDPNHVAAGFPTTCETCHNERRWDDATFDHDLVFALEGAHTSLACEACHADGYTGTPRDCYACHRLDFEQARDPNHVTAGFPITCETCHGQRSWEGATFNHDGLYFPIYSGSHRDEWNRCSDCHVNPANYAIFECINCHEHSQSEMADEHREENGYEWVSTACLRCHPQGRE